jgi:hypothetical protein
MKSVTMNIEEMKVWLQKSNRCEKIICFLLINVVNEMKKEKFQFFPIQRPVSIFHFSLGT